MKEIIIQYLPCLYAFFAVAGFSVVLEEKKPLFIFSASILGFLSWAVYIFCEPLGNGAWGQTFRSLIATMVVAALSEVFARINKAPATIFLIIAILPLVPGGGIYYSMEALIDGNMETATYQMLKTLAIAGAIAVGCSFVSSIVRMIKKTKSLNYERKLKKQNKKATN